MKGPVWFNAFNTWRRVGHFIVPNKVSRVESSSLSIRETALSYLQEVKKMRSKWVGKKTFSGIFAEIILFRIEFISSAFRIGSPLVWRDIDEIPIVVQSSRSVWSAVAWVTSSSSAPPLPWPWLRTWILLCPRRTRQHLATVRILGLTEGFVI